MTEFAPGLHTRAGADVDSSAYDRYVGRWSRLFVPGVIAAADVRSGSLVLDISTGTGEAAVGVLPVIGPSGVLVGADISPEMVRSAVQRVSDPRFLPVAADGQELPFRSACFDAVICQLGLQFFPDPARGLSEFRRVLRPGGKASVCVISHPDHAPMWGYLAEAIARRLPDKRGILMSSFALADPKRLEQLFAGAGFTNVTVQRDVQRGTMKGLDEYWEPIEAGTGSIPQAYLMLQEGERRDVRAEVSDSLSKHIIGNELHLSVEMLIADGQAEPGQDSLASTNVSLPAPIDPKLAEVLACPRTKGALEYDASTSELISRGAGLAYLVREGIPIMLAASARQLS